MANFHLGQVVATPGALAALEDARDNPMKYLHRHASGNWGDVPPEDAAENELSLREGYRIISAYTIQEGVRIWIITEADRSSTTILLPEEY